MHRSSPVHAFDPLDLLEYEKKSFKQTFHLDIATRSMEVHVTTFLHNDLAGSEDLERTCDSDFQISGLTFHQHLFQDLPSM
jgi:hypothetical protein